MVHNETSAEAEQRLRGVLSSISQRDLVILRQMLPGQIRLATSSLVQGSAADNLRTFTYHSSVLSTTANHPAEDRVDCERRLRDTLTGLPKRELQFPDNYRRNSRYNNQRQMHSPAPIPAEIPADTPDLLHSPLDAAAEAVLLS